MTSDLGRWFSALVLPSNLLAVACLLGLLLIGLGRPVAGRALVFLPVAMLIVCLFLPLDQWMLRPLEDRVPRAALPAHVDGVVVLGGAITSALSADRDMPVLNREADRLTAFAALARAYPDARLLFAGGAPDVFNGRLDEPAASIALVGSLGIAAGRIILDDRSRSTAENARNALGLARPKPGEVWVLITSASHMPRALATFEGAGWPPMLPWPVAYRTTRGPWLGRGEPLSVKLEGIDVAAHEYVGLIGYRLLGVTPNRS